MALLTHLAGKEEGFVSDEDPGASNDASTKNTAWYTNSVMIETMMITLPRIPIDEIDCCSCKK
jgi:hypothetical protein